MAGGGVRPPRRLERVMAGAKLFLLPRGEQQRVVDSRPEAEHPGEGGCKTGDVGGGGRPHQRAEAEAEAREGSGEGVARRTQVPQDRDQKHDRDREPDQLADREPAGRGPVDRLAGHRDVDAGALEAGGGVLEPFVHRGVQILGGAVVADRGERGLPVLGDAARGLERIVDRGHVRLPGDRLERAADLAFGPSPGESAVAGAEHERRLGSGLGGEALLEEVLGALRLDAGDGEVVLERAAGRDRAADEGGQHDEDGEARAARSPPDEQGE